MGKKGPWSQGLQYRRHHSPTWSLLCLQMAQELGISEKSPDYRNPFKTDHSEVRWQHCWHILWGSTSTLWLQAAGWAGEGNGWLGGEQPKTPSMEEAYPKHVRQIPQLGCGWFGCPVPSALSCGHLSHGSIGPYLPGAASNLKSPGTAGLAWWPQWLWGVVASRGPQGAPHADPPLSLRSFSLVPTLSRRRCGRKRSGGRRRRSGRRSARARASPARSRSCSTGACASRRRRCCWDVEQLAPSRWRRAGAWQSPYCLCRGFCFVTFLFCLAGAGGGAGVLPQWGWVEPKWGTPSSEPKHRREGSQAIPWAGRVLTAVVG